MTSVSPASEDVWLGDAAEIRIAGCRGQLGLPVGSSAFPLSFRSPGAMWTGTPASCPKSLAKGLVVWGGFSFFMAVAGFTPLVLPAVLLVPPALDRALAPHPHPRGPAGRHAGYLPAHGVLEQLSLPSSARYLGFLLHRAQFFRGYLRPGGGVGVCGAGAAPAAFRRL